MTDVEKSHTTTFLGKLLKFIFGFVIFIVFVLAIVFLIRLYGTGGGAVALEHGSVAAKEFGLPVLKQVGLYDAYLAFFDPTKLWEKEINSDIEKNEYRPEAGVRITKLEPRSSFFEEEKPIVVDAYIDAEAIVNDVEIYFYCKLDDYPAIGKTEYIPAEVSSLNSKNNAAFLKKNQGLERIRATCKFQSGMKIPKDNTLGTPQVVTSKQVEIIARFPFTTLASHKTYMLNKEEYERLISINQNPFEYFKISDPQLNYDRTMKSRTTDGPLQLGISTYQQQPFTEDMAYTIAVGMKDNQGWGIGSMRYLNYLDLKLPDPYFILESDSSYPNKNLMDDTCAFYFTGEIDNMGVSGIRYKVYRLKDEYLSRVNVDCSKDALKDVKDLTTEECIKLYGSQQIFTCDFQIPELPAEEGIFADFFFTEASYIFEVKKSAAINIRKYHDVPTTGPLIT